MTNQLFIAMTGTRDRDDAMETTEYMLEATTLTEALRVAVDTVEDSEHEVIAINVVGTDENREGEEVFIYSERAKWLDESAAANWPRAVWGK